MAAEQQKPTPEATPSPSASQHDAPPGAASAPGSISNDTDATSVPPPGGVVPPELSPLTDNTHGDMDDPAIQSGLNQMKETVAEEQKGLKELGAKIQDAKEHEKELQEE